MITCILILSGCAGKPPKIEMGIINGDHPDPVHSYNQKTNAKVVHTLKEMNNWICMPPDDLDELLQGFVP